MSRLRRRLAAPDSRLLQGVTVRKRGFWAGWGGVVTAVVLGAVLVALLVGWVLLWVYRPGGPSITLLTLGSIAFAAVLVVLTTLVVQLRGQTRLRNAEAVFLAAASHNLRTPLAGIRAAAQTLQRPELPPDRRDALLERIVHETGRLGRLVDNILESGRLEVEGVAFENALIAMTDLVQVAVADLAPIAELQGGSVHFTASDACLVHGDRTALRLLIDNLLDNALKYSEGAPDIRVGVEPVQGFALVRVTDAGLGFSTGHSESLFRRFARGSDTGRPGTGLGLALARAIARGHGGDVHLSSEGLGRGATAELWLPLAGARPEERP